MRAQPTGPADRSLPGQAIQLHTIFFHPAEKSNSGGQTPGRHRQGMLAELCRGPIRVDGRISGVLLQRRFPLQLVPWN